MRTVLKYQPSWLTTVPKLSTPRTWPPIKKKTPTGARLITQTVMVIIASAMQVKKSRRGFPFSPSLASAMPSMIAKKTNPRILDPFVHSPNIVN